jgi:DMSO/TMAO reductase YedYZ molybdopterin-dependent catalytic subunit
VKNSSVELIVRDKEPLNLEMPFSALEGPVTPNECFYVRCHFPIPQIDAQDWRLKIEGEIAEPFELSYDQLLALPARSISATLECAGNSRSFLNPKVKGVPWVLGAVGNAIWEGVPLSVLLERAKVKPGATEVIFEGADKGRVEGALRPFGEIPFARSVSLKKANSDVLLAYRMNGEKLSPSHGFPLRVIVPGWYAVASIKWLQRIIVTGKPFAGYFQSVDYAFWERRDELATLRPITELQVKAEISRPGMGEVLPANTTVKVHGAAWGSDAEIAKVQISVDSGASWHEAQLSGKQEPNAWALWEYDWRTPNEPGKRTLIARATDSRGRSQPTDRDNDRGTYMINHLLPIEVDVR